MQSSPADGTGRVVVYNDDTEVQVAERETYD